MWTKKAEQLKFIEKKSWTETAEIISKEYPGVTLAAIRSRLRRSEKYPGKPKEKKEKTEKVEIFENQTPEVISENWRGNKILRFGLIGDTHINSKYCQLTHLHHYYDLCKEMGVKVVYHTGDIDEGERMRTGHSYECYNQGADDHVAEIVRVYPKRDGIVTKFITGNHDASTIKHCGSNMGPAIAAERKDMIYLGSDCAIINLTPNCTLELRHPWNGTGYADSYQIQKIVEAMEADSKPNILAVGHYHKALYQFPRNVHSFLTGTYQSQTPFTRGKNLRVQMGGWIVEAEVDKNGTIQTMIPRFVPEYKAIEDDWKNWR